jgi:hypothetical protein
MNPRTHSRSEVFTKESSAMDMTLTHAGGQEDTRPVGFSP